MVPACALLLVLGGSRRPPTPRPFEPGTPGDAKSARVRFEAANAQGAFVRLPSPPPEGPWEGVVGEKGLLRLMATGPGLFRVGVARIE